MTKNPRKIFLNPDKKNKSLNSHYFEKKLNDLSVSAIFERFDIEVVGFWQEEVGRSDRLLYITRFTDSADRDAKWAAFQADPEWQRVRLETEAEGPIVARVLNSYMKPVPFSPLQ